MERVFLLTHEHGYLDSQDYEELEQKYLGVYSSREAAEEAAQRYYILPGFNKYPFDSFYIEEVELDKDSGWEEGFVSWSEDDEL